MQPLFYMNTTGFFLIVIFLSWIFGGGFWLFRERQYSLYQLPRFGVDLMGLPVELAQKIWGKKGVPC